MEDGIVNKEWMDYLKENKEPELQCCISCGRDCHGALCNRCNSNYETPSMDSLEQLAGRWDFDIDLLTDDEIQDLTDLVQQATREDCPSYRQEKIYEAFESAFDGYDFG